MPPVTAFRFKRSAVSAEGKFTGLASTFDGAPDRGGDVIARGAFARTVARLAADGVKLPLLWNHDAADPIGWLESVTETEAGLEVEGQLMMELRQAKIAHDLMKAGAAYLSIGYRVERSRDRADGAKVLEQIDLAEVSVVTTPMNPAARVTAVKADIFESAVQFERAARDVLGLSAREAKRLSRGGWSALTRNDEPDDAELAAVAARLQSISKSLR